MEDVIENITNPHSEVVTVSLVKCVQHLADAYTRRIGSNITLGREPLHQRSQLQQKKLKQKIYDALFHKYILQEYQHNSLTGYLLSCQAWQTREVCDAASFRMRCKQETCKSKRFDFLVEELLKVKSGKYEPVLQLLLCLARPEEVLSTIPLYPKKNRVFLGNEKDKDLSQPSIMHLHNAPVHVNDTTSGHCKKFSQQSLYGALAHSRTSTINVELSLPDLSQSNKLDLCRYLRDEYRSNDDDEGFVSPGASTSPISEVSNHMHTDDDDDDGIGCSYSGMLFNDDEPYIGYRTPRYDIGSWTKCLGMKRSDHRTWETVGMPAGSTLHQWYLSECGNSVFDFMWKQRWQIVVELASALYSKSKSNVVAPTRHQWYEVDEDTLVHHSQLVAVGIASESFHFNKLACIFIARKGIHIKGVTACSTRSVLKHFAEWGTCYWRLMKFSSLGFSSSGADHRGYSGSVIFKALCGGIRNYLLGFQCSLLMIHESKMSLQRLFYLLQKPGAQIKYLSHLCRCGDIHDATSSLAGVHFPVGIELLTYLYEEAVHCTQSGDHSVLLYLLRKCCQPYLHFVQSWVFHGSYSEVTGEFLLQVNADNGAKRDRRRWNKYIEVVRPNDIKSCVPSFLAPVADDMWICGKSLELFQIICPEHFLCMRLFPSPDLLVTYSKSRMQKLTRQWNGYESSMRELEGKRHILWKSKQEENEESRNNLVNNSRAAYEEQMKEAATVEKELRLEAHQMKLVELKRLKKQAEDDAIRRKQVRTKEKEADIMWQRQLLDKENLLKQKEKLLLEEAKNAMISHYESMYEEAERRKDLAMWKIKRHNLQEKRLEFLKEKVHILDDNHFENASPHSELVIADNLSTSEINNDKSSDTFNDNSTHISQILHINEEISTDAFCIKTTQQQDERPAWMESSITRIENIPHISDESTQAVNHVSSIAMCTSHASDESRGDNTFERRKKSNHSHISDQQIHCIGNTAANQASDAFSYSENLLGKQPHVSNQTEQSEVTKIKKSVGNEHVSRSSVFQDSSSPDTVIHKKSVDGKHVSDSTMNLRDECAPPLRTVKKLVNNFHVSNSSLPFILSEEKCRKETIQSNENVAFVEVQQECDIDQSTIHEHTTKEEPIPPTTPGPIADSLSKSVEANDQIVLLPDIDNVITEKYDMAEDKLENEVGKEFGSFNLQLPVNGVYDDYVSSVRQNLHCDGKKNGRVSLKMVDLHACVVDDITSFLDNDEDLIEEFANNNNTTSSHLHSLPILLRNCVLRPIKSQAALVNRCIVNYFMIDLSLPRHFEMMRHFLLFEDGEFAQTLSNELFNMIHGGCRPLECLNPVMLDSILTRSIQSSTKRNSPLTSNLSFNVKFLPPAFSSTDLHAMNCMELCYHVDWPLNVVITESCHNKYNLVLSFLLQLKHVVWSLKDIRTRLNRIVNQRPSYECMSTAEIHKIHIYRHEMHNFVKVMQGYVSTQVLNVCWQEFREELDKNVRTLDDLHLRHAEYINKCVLRCLLTPKAQNVMNVICDVLKCILRFRSQLATPSISFTNLQRTYREFTRFSNFLYRVVSKLVERGYQPHLEDFLIRLNFNGFYKT